MPNPKNKRTFLGISGLSPQAIEALRERARDNNRSVSGELREIIEAELSSCDSSAHGAQTTGGN
jgi:plasmid stability protein